MMSKPLLRILPSDLDYDAIYGSALSYTKPVKMSPSSPCELVKKIYGDY